MQVCLSFPICVSGVQVEAVFCPPGCAFKCLQVLHDLMGPEGVGWEPAPEPGYLRGLSRTFHSHAYPAAITI